MNREKPRAGLLDGDRLAEGMVGSGVRPTVQGMLLKGPGFQ